MMKKKYSVIYADPPWDFSNANVKSKGVRTTVSDQYATMGQKAIETLPVSSVVADDCVLLMWTTDAHLRLAMDVIEAWGFKYKTVGFVWVKRNASGKPAMVLGPWGMKSHELCLLATRGKGHSLLKARNTRQLLEAERTGHSRKPDEARKRIELMFPGCDRLELFAREKNDGWDVFGDEVDGSITI